MAEKAVLKNPIRRDVAILVALAMLAVIVIAVFIALLSKRSEIREEVSKEDEKRTEIVRPATEAELSTTVAERERARVRDEFFANISGERRAPATGQARTVGQARTGTTGTTRTGTGGTTTGPQRTGAPPGSLGRPSREEIARAEAEAREELQRKMDEALATIGRPAISPGVVPPPTLAQPQFTAPPPPPPVLRVNTRMSVTSVREQEETAPTRMRALRKTDIHPGTLVQAHLSQDVDTRVGQRVILQTNRPETVKDGEIVIPAGTIFFGQVGNPKPGMRFMPIEINLMVVPGKGTVQVRGYVMSGSGHLGMPARYRSNILRAVAPSIALVAVGQELEKQGVDTRAPPTTGPSPVPGFIVQQPTLAQRTFPQIESEIRGRFGNSEPYFTAKKGETALIVIEEIVDAQVLKK